MEKRLKIAVVFMALAVLLMPLAIFFKKEDQNYSVIVLVLTMILELIGLIFVMYSIKNRNKTNVQNHD